ncbi:MAG: cyclic nucleotide-binding domain-containing protein [Candidatus Wallbacteria bacterium]|nr:cyclic nucleotide-binding domain-containing protein [Candidatus Wallbacteria bacterium]
MSTEPSAGGAPAATAAPPEGAPKLAGEALAADALLAIPIFKGISKSLLEKNAGAVSRRRFKKGELICREGDFGSTAFYVLSGKVEVYIATPMAHVKTSGGVRGFFQKLKSFLVSKREDPRDARDDRLIPIDAPIDLPFLHPQAQLGEGELFGEMTCMSRYPRSATVRAAEDCEMLEMLSNILSLLLKNPAFKDKADKNYRERALEQHLRSLPILKGLSSEFIDRLRSKVELVRYDPGQVIFRQGDPSDAFYLVRIGFVKVSQQAPGGDVVLAYSERGSHFGEMGILAQVPRGATCTALDHVELVRIPADDFRSLVNEYPNIRQAMELVTRARQAESIQRLAITQSVPLEAFLEQGLMEAQNLLLLDLDRCTRCDECVRACASAHDGVTRLIRVGLRFDRYLVPTSCRTCRDPLCMIGCPVGAIRRRHSLEIVIEDWCIGCGVCAKGCPYGNITMHPFNVDEPDPKNPGTVKAVMKKKATTCDLCTEHAQPACVAACPHEAAMRVAPHAFFSEQLSTGQPPTGRAAKEGNPAPGSKP